MIPQLIHGHRKQIFPEAPDMMQLEFLLPDMAISDSATLRSIMISGNMIM